MRAPPFRSDRAMASAAASASTSGIGSGSPTYGRDVSETVHRRHRPSSSRHHGRRKPHAKRHVDEMSADVGEAVEPAASPCHVDGNDVDAGMPQSEEPVPFCHVDEKSTRRGRPPKYHTDEDRVAAERQRKLAWARARRRAGLLKETAESLRERQRRRRARLRASGEVGG